MIVVSLSLWVLAAICNAVMDTLAHHFAASIFTKWSWNFWDPRLSWGNKRYDDDKWYGWVNNTILVWVTDGWHLFQMLMKTFIVLSIIFYQPIVTWYWDVLIFTVTWGIIFEIFYKYLLKK